MICVMEVTLPPELEPLIHSAVESGRYATAGDLVEEALREKLEQQLWNRHLVKLAEEAIAEGGFEEQPPDWRERLLALAAERRAR